MTANKQKSKLTKREDILHTLRERIVEGDYPQGVKLVEQDLAREFEVEERTIDCRGPDVEKRVFPSHGQSYLVLTLSPDTWVVT